MNAIRFIAVAMIVALSLTANAPALADNHYEGTFVGTVVSQGYFEVAPPDQMGEVYCHIRVRAVFQRGRPTEMTFWGHFRICDAAKVGVYVVLVVSYGDSWGAYESKITDITVSTRERLIVRSGATYTKGKPS